MTSTKKKVAAYYLFITGKFDQKEIAELLDTREQTVGKWVRDGGWRKKREEQAEEILSMEGRMLKIVTTVISNIEKKIDEGKEPSPGDADQLAKYWKLLQQIRGKMSTALLARFMSDIMEWMMREDLELAKRIEPHMKKYLQLKLEEAI